MSKSKITFTKLNYGEIHMYYPIIFETDLSFSKLCDTIFCSDICYNKRFCNRKNDELGSSLANTVSEYPP